MLTSKGLLAMTSSFAVLLMLSGCGTTGLPGLRPLTYETAAETRMFYSLDPKVGCPHEGGRESSVVLTAIATALIKQGLSNFGATLRKGAEGGQLVRSVALVNLDLPMATVPSCVVVIRGNFWGGQVPLSDKHPLVSLVGEIANPEGFSESVKAMNIPTVDQIEYYLEMSARVSVTGRLMTMAPVVLLLNRSIDGARKGTRRVVVAVSIERLGADKIESAVDLATLEIGRKYTYFRYPDAKYYPHEMPWFSTPFESSLGTVGKTDSAKAPVAPKKDASAVPSTNPSLHRIGQPPDDGGKAAALQIATKENAVPVIFRTTVAEARPTKESLAFFATLFEEVSPVLETRGILAVDEAARVKARFAELTARTTLRADAASQKATAIGLIASYCEAEDGDAGDLALKAALAYAGQLKANAAAAAAAEAEPYPLLLQVNGGGVPGSYNAQFCAFS